MSRPYPFTTEQQEEICVLYQEGWSRNKLASHFGGSRQTVTNLLMKRLGEMRSKEERQRREGLNHLVFDDLEPENVRYWVGFLMADGCISITKHTKYLICQLSIVDKAHLENLRSFLGSDHKISLVTRRPTEKSNHCVRLSVGNSHICEKLISYGMIPRKHENTYVCKKLAFDRHFWRGYVDGNGTVGLQRKRQNYLPSLQLSGCFGLVKQFSEYAASIHIYGSRNITSGRNKNWHKSFSGFYANQVIRELYTNCTVSLERKQVSAEESLREFDYPLDKKLTRRELYQIRK